MSEPTIVLEIPLASPPERAAWLRLVGGPVRTRIAALALDDGAPVPVGRLRLRLDLGTAAGAPAVSTVRVAATLVAEVLGQLADLVDEERAKPGPRGERRARTA